MSDLSPRAKRDLDKALQLLAGEGRETATAAIRQALAPLTGGDGTDIAPGALPPLGGDLAGRIAAAIVVGLQSHPVSSVPPTAGQALVWDGTSWKPGAPGDASGLIDDFSSLVNEALATLGATATASSYHPGFAPASSPQPPGYLIDGNESTFWQSSWGVPGGPYTGVNGQWARVDLGSAKAITYYRLGGISVHGPPTWKLQSSTDGSTWTDRNTGTGDADTGIVAVTGGPITARYWRVLATSENPYAPSQAVSWAVRTLALYSGAPIQAATGHAIQDEGVNRTQRAILDFQGAGVTVTDDAGNHKTVVTIPGTDVYATDVELAAAVALLIARSLIDAKGDLIVGLSDNTPGRLAVGTNDYVLTADSTQTAGVKWAPASGSGGAPVDATYVTRTANGTLTNEVPLAQVYAHELKTRWEPITNGDHDYPEIYFMDGEVLLMEVPN